MAPGRGEHRSPVTESSRGNDAREAAPPSPRGPLRGCVWRGGCRRPGSRVCGGTVCALPGVRSGCLRPRRVSRGGTTRSHPGTVGTWLGPQPCARPSADLGPGRRGTRALLRRALTGSARFDALRSVSPSSKCLCLFPFHEVMKLEKPVCADPPQWSSWVAFTGRRPFAVTSWGQRCPSCFSRGPPLTDGEPG